MILVGTKRLNRTCDWNYSFSVLWPAFLNSLTRIHLEKFETLSLVQRYKTLSRRRPTIDSCHRCVHIRGNSLETSLCNFVNREFLRLCLEHYTRPRNNREKTRTLIEKKSSYLPRIVCQNDVSWFSWSRFFFSQLLIIASLDADTLVCGFHEGRVGNIGASWPPLYKVCALPLPLGCSPIRATSPRLGKPHAVSRKLFFFPQYIFDSFYHLCVYIYIYFLYISKSLR